MSELKDVYKEVPNWREAHKGMSRPEYVLKNGSARNCYGLLKDIHGLQEENQRLTSIATKHATRADELYEALGSLLDTFERDATEDEMYLACESAKAVYDKSRIEVNCNDA